MDLHDPDLDPGTLSKGMITIATRDKTATTKTTKTTTKTRRIASPGMCCMLLRSSLFCNCGWRIRFFGIQRRMGRAWLLGRGSQECCGTGIPIPPCFRFRDHFECDLGCMVVRSFGRTGWLLDELHTYAEMDVKTYVEFVVCFPAHCGRHCQEKRGTTAKVIESRRRYYIRYVYGYI